MKVSPIFQNSPARRAHTSLLVGEELNLPEAAVPFLYVFIY